MLEGDAERDRRADRRGVARTRSSGELMGDVLVYVDPRDQRAGCSRSRARWPTPPAARWSRWWRAASRRRRRAGGGGRRARGDASRALAVPPRGAPGGAGGRDRGALARRRAGREHDGRLRPRRRRRPRRPTCRSSATASACRCRAARRESVSAIYGGQLHATARTPLPAVFAVNSAALRDEPQAAGAGERVPARAAGRARRACGRRSSRRSCRPTRASTSRPPS